MRKENLVDNYDNSADQFDVTTGDHEAFVTLDDLLSSSSDVLNRIAREIENDGQTTAHSSSVSGHKSGGSHNSHSSQSQIEHPLA
jgi:hypothetical protein